MHVKVNLPLTANTRPRYASRMGLADFIKRRLGELGKNPRSASLEASDGKNPDVIRNIYEGKSESPRGKTFKGLARALECTVDEMLEAAAPDDTPAHRIKFASLSPRKIPGIPVLGEVAAGAWLEVEQFDESKYEPLPFLPDARFPAERQFAVRVRGTSINKTAQNGQFLLCLAVEYDEEGTPIFPDGELVVIERTKQDGTREATVKRARRGADGWELHHESNDPRHQGVLRADDGLRRDEEGYEVRVIGTVLWSIGYVGPLRTMR